MFALEPPRGVQAARDRARQEAVEALAEPGAGGVLGRRDADVVAAAVLDEEVAVERLRERDLAEPLLERFALVTELVGGVDRHAPDDRGADPERPQLARAHQP